MGRQNGTRLCLERKMLLTKVLVRDKLSRFKDGARDAEDDVVDAVFNSAIGRSQSGNE